MKRTPVKLNQLPRCFGLGHEAEPEYHGCDACDVRGTCHKLADKFASHVSVRGWATKVRRDRDAVEADDLPTIYAELYRRVYGRPCRHAHTPSTIKKLERAAQQAEENGVPIRTWINGNLHGMKMAVRDGQHQKYGFQPNMLCGANARNRVRVFVEKGRVKVGRDTFEAFDRDNPKRAIEDEIVASEADILTSMLLLAQRGEVREFDTVASEVQGTVTWELFDRVRREGHSNVMVRLTLDGARAPHEKRFFQHLNGHDFYKLEDRVPSQALEIALSRIDPLLTDSMAMAHCPTQLTYNQVASLLSRTHPIIRDPKGPMDSYRPGRYATT